MMTITSSGRVASINGPDTPGLRKYGRDRLFDGDVRARSLSLQDLSDLQAHNLRAGLDAQVSIPRAPQDLRSVITLLQNFRDLTRDNEIGVRQQSFDRFRRKGHRLNTCSSSSTGGC